MKKTNYHTHTYRCGHAVGDERVMVKAAIKNNLDVLGFSDHVPLPHYRLHILKGIRYAFVSTRAFLSAMRAIKTNGPAMRMPFKTRNDHLRIVRRLKEEYKDQITIYQGFEAEYFEEYLDYYQDMLDKGLVDYLILGNHFNKYSIGSRYYAQPRIDDQFIIDYKNNLLDAMDSELFSYIAHPDLFMVGKVRFDDLCEQVTREICQKALEKDVPLEINHGGMRRGLRKVDDEMLYPYPNSHFFDIVGEYGCKVIYGIDAHDPSEINDEAYKEMEKFAKKHNLNVIDTLEFKKGKPRD